MQTRIYNSQPSTNVIIQIQIQIMISFLILSIIMILRVYSGELGRIISFLVLKNYLRIKGIKVIIQIQIKILKRFLILSIIMILRNYSGELGRNNSFLVLKKYIKINEINININIINSLVVYDTALQYFYNFIELNSIEIYNLKNMGRITLSIVFKLIYNEGNKQIINNKNIRNEIRININNSMEFNSMGVFNPICSGKFYFLVHFGMIYNRKIQINNKKYTDGSNGGYDIIIHYVYEKLFKFQI